MSLKPPQSSSTLRTLCLDGTGLSSTDFEELVEALRVKKLDLFLHVSDTCLQSNSLCSITELSLRGNHGASRAITSLGDWIAVRSSV